jgi:hypothetical protein
VFKGLPQLSSQDLHLLQNEVRSFTKTFVPVSRPLLIPPSFPKIFASNLSREGTIMPEIVDPISDVHSVPSAASMQNTSGLHFYLDVMTKSFTELNLKEFESGYQQEDFKDIVNHLQTITDQYNDV